MEVIGRRIYFDTVTGEILLDKGEMTGDVKNFSLEEDKVLFPQLQAETIDYMEFPYGQTPEGFFTSGKVKVDPALKQLIFFERPQITISKDEILSDGIDSTEVNVSVSDSSFEGTVIFTIDNINNYSVKATNGVAKFEFASVVKGEFTIIATTEKYGSTFIKVEVI